MTETTYTVEFRLAVEGGWSAWCPYARAIKTVPEARAVEARMAGAGRETRVMRVESTPVDDDDPTRGYIDAGATRCPYCRRGEVLRDASPVADDSANSGDPPRGKRVLTACSCLKCHNEWIEVYILDSLMLTPYWRGSFNGIPFFGIKGVKFEAGAELIDDEPLTEEEVKAVKAEHMPRVKWEIEGIGPVTITDVDSHGQCFTIKFPESVSWDEIVKRFGPRPDDDYDEQEDEDDG